MHRDLDFRIAAEETHKDRKRGILRAMGMDPDKAKQPKKIKNCAVRKERIRSADLIREYQDEQQEAVA